MPEATVFTFSTLVLAIPFAVCGIAAVAAVLLFAIGRRSQACIAVLVALVAGLVFGPAMLNDRVVVTEESIEQTTGFWWLPTVKGFQYVDVASVRVTRKRFGPKRKVRVIWEVRNRNGTSQDIDPGDLWESNSDEIIPLLQKYGVDIRNVAP